MLFDDRGEKEEEMFASVIRDPGKWKLFEYIYVGLPYIDMGLPLKRRSNVVIINYFCYLVG